MRVDRMVLLIIWIVTVAEEITRVASYSLPWLCYCSLLGTALLVTVDGGTDPRQAGAAAGGHRLVLLVSADRVCNSCLLLHRHQHLRLYVGRGICVSL